ncbi:MAG: type 4a pilus biogenesis protein PilO [Deltaproteobacteria bacterium]|nr:type 4a pilus biogenesis protein PilO [Deltaproteobacteria bacterium]
MTISPRNLDRICLTVVIISSLLFGYWMLQLGFKQQIAIRQEKQLRIQQTKDLKLAEANLKLQKAGIETVRGNIKTLNMRIPEKSDMGTLLKELDGLMKKRDIVLITVQPQTPVKEKLYTRIPLRLVFKGSFFNISSLLQDLESMNRLVVMEKMIIGKNSLTRDCQADLTALVFERDRVPVTS